MSTKRQFKMYLTDDLLDRLKRAAERAGKESGQEVVEEVLAIYLPVWSNVNESMHRAVNYQARVIVEEELRRGKKIGTKAKSPIPIERGAKNKKKVA